MGSIPGPLLRATSTPARPEVDMFLTSLPLGLMSVAHTLLETMGVLEYPQHLQSQDLFGACFFQDFLPCCPSAPCTGAYILIHTCVVFLTDTLYWL